MTKMKIISMEYLNQCVVQ